MVAPGDSPSATDRSRNKNRPYAANRTGMPPAHDTMQPEADRHSRGGKPPPGLSTGRG